MNPKTFPHAPAQALVPGRGGRGRKATPVPPADATPESLPCPSLGTRVTEAPLSAGADVAPKAASAPSADAVEPKTSPHSEQAPRSAGTGVVATPVPHVPPDLQCEYGNYPWDRWQRKALAAGVAPELADLGRAVMREAYQHDWDKRLKMLCGWNDHGRCIIQQALHCPAVVRQRWQRMLDTDGYRGEWVDGEWRPRQ